ncbi:hypothetical protein [Niallia taxi]|uniref:hypothetical protein n=1 Tax=Niallia taxi TaxID=2499688 RepID=UPI0015F47613|nr:hypothetical protein [Niallia taxi]
MEIFILIFIGVVLFNIIKVVTRSTKGSNNRRSSLSAGAVGGAASTYFMHQLMDQHDLNEETIREMEQMNLQQMQEFALQNDLSSQMELQRMMEQSMDPYQNPGVDIVVDESYHGIDHGMNDHSMHDHNNHNHFNNF